MQINSLKIFSVTVVSCIEKVWFNIVDLFNIIEYIWETDTGLIILLHFSGVKQCESQTNFQVKK